MQFDKNSIFAGLFYDSFNDYVFPTIKDWVIVEIEDDGIYEFRKKRFTFFSTREEALNFFKNDFMKRNNINGNFYDETLEEEDEQLLICFDKNNKASSTGFTSIEDAVNNLNKNNYICLDYFNIFLTNKFTFRILNDHEHCYSFNSHNSSENSITYYFSDFNKTTVDNFMLN